MFHLKLAIDLAATILSGGELITRLLKKFLSSSETIGNLANLDRFPRVDGYSERLKNMKTQDRPDHVIYFVTHNQVSYNMSTL